MLTIAAALDEILRRVRPLPVSLCRLDEALGLTLAADVFSPVEVPPFNKALMDGYAVRSVDFVEGAARLSVLERVTAGEVPRYELIAGTATEIMTGAPLPVGSDAVVRVEVTQRDGNEVICTAGRVLPGDNLILRGATRQVGQCVVKSGDRLTPAILGALAELGVAQVPVRRAARVAVLATGNELVPWDAVPGPGQIRNSNELMLVSQLRQRGVVCIPLGIARDEPTELRDKILQGLDADVLVLSGGVSAGQLDLVPGVLESLGVSAHFHKVQMKPGKPLLFGTWSRRGAELTANGTSASVPTASDQCVVFGLPGNPVSSLVCAEVFVQAALRALAGQVQARPQLVWRKLTQDFRHRSDRPTFHAARWEDSPALGVNESAPSEGVSPLIQSADQIPHVGGVRLLPWQGSSDLQAMTMAEALVLLPAGELTITAGSLVAVLPLGAG